MAKLEDNPDPVVERRVEKRVTYSSILGFKELKGQKIPSNPFKPNATGANLSLGGICFLSEKRPKCDFVILYLADGARAVARVASVTQDVGSLEYASHCEVVQWLPDGVTTLETLNSQPVNWPVSQHYSE